MNRRLTRGESQDRTREQLVTTAAELFLERGFFATSLDKVAEEAGYSKGAVYSNFAGKHQLCLAVLDRIHEQQVVAIREEFDGAATVEEGLAALGRWAERHIGDRDWTALEAELATVARHDEELRRQLAQRRTAVRDAVASVVEALAATFDVRLALPCEAAANLVLSAGVGLGVQRALDPDVPVDALTDVVRLLLPPRPE